MSAGLKHKFNTLPIVILIAVTVVVAMIFCLVNDVFFFGTQTKEVSFESIDDVSTLQTDILLNVENSDDVYGFNGNILKWQSRQIVWLDKKGNQTNISDGELNQPIFDSSDNYLVIAEKGQTNISVYKNSSLLWSDDLDGEIYNVSINSSGYVCVLRSFIGYKSALEVYNPTGSRIFYNCKAHNKIISAQVSDDSKQVLVHSVVLSGVDVVSCVETLDMLGNVIATYESDKVCLSVRYVDSNNVLLANDDSLMFLNNKLDIITESSNLTLSDVAVTDGNMVAVLGDEVNESNEYTERNIMIFNKNGQLRRKLHLGNKITDITPAGKSIAVNLGNMFIIVSDGGRIQGGCKAERNIQRVKLIDGSHVAAITGDKAYICKF